MAGRGLFGFLSRATLGLALVACGSAVDDGGQDAGFGGLAPEAGTLPADRFITKVVSFTPGPCAGYGEDSLPGVVLGPPVGGGACMGSTNVLSLGNGGEIVVSFEPNAIVDGPGVDFIVFENPFYIGSECGGRKGAVDAEPAQISVSDDGTNWTSFPCTQTTAGPPYQMCAGVHPVYSNPDNDVSPVDPETAGGDPYDLHDIGVKRARYVRITDEILEPCPASGPRLDTNGFDLDAISIVHGALP